MADLYRELSSAGEHHKLRMTGLVRDDIRDSHFIVAAKGEELRWLLTGYDDFLEQNSLVDHAAVLKIAIELLGSPGRRDSGQLVMVLSDSPFSALEKELIRRVAGKNLPVIGHASGVKSSLFT